MSAWLSLQLAVTAAAAALRWWPVPDPVERRGLARALLLASVVLPSAWSVWPAGSTPFEAPVRVASSPTGGAPRVTGPLATVVEVPEAALALPSPLPLLLVGGLGAFGLRLVRLRGALERSVVVHRLRGVEVRVGDQSFAAWWFGRRIVVLDAAVFADPADRAVALRHELQHHRTHDPAVAWWAEGLRLACWPNPAAAWLVRESRALDELATDLLLLPRLGLKPYADTLLRAASRPVAGPPLVAGLDHPTLLHRRLLAMTLPPPRRRGPLALAPVLLVATTTFAADGLVRDVRVGPGELRRLARDASDDALRIPDDPAVGEALERLLADPERLDEALARRAEVEPVLVDALRRHGVPEQLAALPLVESGYRALPASANPVGAAGVWQFIPSTARTYGLVVDGATDQRLELEAASDAAARLLADEHEAFGDWGLAIAAYNVGGQAVQDAIDSQGTRDVMVLVEACALPDYPALVFAAMLADDARAR